MKSMCRLCNNNPAIEGGHVIPKFVSDTIKKNSPTGFLRNPNNVNRRIQDGDKLPLLCENCEARFSKREKHFSEQVFNPFQEDELQSLTYGSWLTYFIVSVSWRSLVLDLGGFEADSRWNDADLQPLRDAEQLMRDYLLDQRDNVGTIENHLMIGLDQVTSTSPTFTKPNVILRTSTVAYALMIPADGAYYVSGNLAGIIFCTVIAPSASDKYEGTRINADGGTITAERQRISSPAMHDLLKLFHEATESSLSQRQESKVLHSIQKNPNAGQSKAIEFAKADLNLGKP